ncbi:2-hydroxyacid dehydrogenase [Collinsella vaginalis]|uniref:2-hydroxyacid dehydrogenase n=1 Tax=Collinsella vaginalis TaxID=1870987 RepID=UPI000A267346|nr:2-hydroxyacid dehydrogenase [Collinsella vaginalis]
MHIALLEPLGISAERVQELARPLMEAGHSFTSFDTKTTDPAELTRRAAGAEVVMIANNPLPAEVIRALPDLKMIAVAFTGIDHVALDVCRERGITVCNCAGYSDVAVAELTVGLAIDVLRQVAAGDAAVRGCGTNAGLTGREIAGKTVGIVGTGHIGTRAGRLFSAFGARVLGYARHENPEATAAGIEHVDLETLLHESDIVSLHLPLNDATRKSFDADKIAQMKPDAVFINCARGAIVGNDALAQALTEGRIAGAGIDVFDAEPPIDADYALLKAPNTIFTPHVAFLTEEAMARRAVIEFGNVSAWAAGTPENVCPL